MLPERPRGLGGHRGLRGAIPKFWERYFLILRSGNYCKLSLEVMYSFAALLLPVAALLVVMGPFE